MGFFSVNETRSKSRPDGKVYSCASCGLYQKVLCPRIEPFGKFKKRIMNIGEAPGETEDRRGKPWQGQAGQVLQRMYEKLGIDLFEDCININSINCRPTSSTGNRPPATNEINACRGRVLQAIHEYKPHMIVLLGGTAVQSVIGNQWKKNLGGIGTWRGWTIPDRGFGAWVCPVFHPSYVMREEKNPAVSKIWQMDLENALTKLDEPLSFTDERDRVNILTDPHEVEAQLGKLCLSSSPVTVDFETTGIKPHRKGHQVACISIADIDGNAHVFLKPKRKKGMFELKRLFHSQVGKIAHNMKYEDTWAAERLHPIQNWTWDTMLAAHMLDNRPGITGLKFQTYVHLGVPDYDSSITQYIHSSGSSANEMNKVFDAPEDELMMYCGLDTIYTYEIAKRQMKQMGMEDLLNGTRNGLWK